MYETAKETLMYRTVLVTLIVRYYLLVTESIKVSFKNNSVMREKAKQDAKETPLRRGLSVGLAPVESPRGLV